MSRVRALLEDLIRRRSVTPDDAGCQDMIGLRLQALGFDCERLDSNGVSNLWAVRKGHRPGPLVAFVGHTDVVPTGPLDRWLSDPFEPTEREGRLYGRGAADMKASVAAWVVAVEDFVALHADHAGSVAVLLTSDEEGPATDGTIKVVQELERRGITVDCTIVGEPTSVDKLGDTIKNGRRGTLSGRLRVRGIQGHVAYPDRARNPIHQFAPALAELASTKWDDGNAHFPPTTWQVSNIRSGTGATNIIPGELEAQFNFRFSTASTADGLKARVHEILDRHGLEYSLDWTLGGEAFLTVPGTLSNALTDAIRAETGVTAELSTTGGTSDGRFMARISPQVVEFGPNNATIHQIGEHARLEELEPLARIYLGTLQRLLVSAP